MCPLGKRWYVPREALGGPAGHAGGGGWMNCQTVSQTCDVGTIATCVISIISLVGNKKAVEVAVLVIVGEGVTVGVGVKDGVTVGVLLGGKVGVMTTNCASTVASNSGEINSVELRVGVKVGGGVALMAWVGTKSVGATVTSRTNCGPSGISCGWQATAIHTTKSMIHRILPRFAIVCHLARHYRPHRFLL